jgi:hypothetical protein
MFNTFDDIAAMLAHYTSPSRFRSGQCTALAVSLEQAAPDGMADTHRAALALVRARATEVDAIATSRERTAPPALRAPRNNTTVRWTALNTALLTVGEIPSDVTPDAATAQRIALSLFPSGTSFGTADAATVWVHSRRLLERIDTEGLAASIDALVHPALLASVRRAHAELGAATGLAGRGDAGDAQSLAEACARFAFAVTSYARAMSVGIGDRDHEAAARFAKALAPIDTYRITTGKNGDDDEELDPVEPVVDNTPPRPGGPTPPPFG